MRIVGRRRLVALIAALATGVGAASALGAAETITSSTICCTFTKGSFTIDQGEVATFQTAGDAAHNVTASGNGPDRQSLFASETITSGQAPVKGTQYLTTGSYDFVCTLHPGMVAGLTVTANGTAVPRPGVTLKITSSKLEKVLASGRLKVKVTALAASDDVSLVARKGARKLGSKLGLDLAAGSSTTVKLKLTQSAKGALADLESARVKVAAALPFGSPAAAKRKLR